MKETQLWQQATEDLHQWTKTRRKKSNRWAVKQVAEMPKALLLAEAPQQQGGAATLLKPTRARAARTATVKKNILIKKSPISGLFFCEVHT